MIRNKPSAMKTVYEYLQTHDYLTSKEAFDMFGITRLSSIIFTLKKYGYNIESVAVTSKNRYGNTCIYTRYYLRDKEK